MLEVKDLTFRYLKDKPLFENFNLKLETEKITGLCGPSGFGKSTLAKLIAGYINPLRGEILYNGKPFEKGYQKVQLIYQHPELAVDPLWHMHEVLAEGNGISRSVLRNMGIKEEWKDRFSSELSGGELQRHSVARALGKGTEYVICDEITTMLDPISQASLWHGLINEVKKRNIGLLVITHNLYLAEKICDSIINLDKPH